MMQKIKCQLEVISNSNHVQQIYCGLELLAKTNKIQLAQSFDEDSVLYKSNCQQPSSIHSGGVKLCLNDNIKIYYDINDGEQLDSEGLEWSHFYFKRSFSTLTHSVISNKIKPLDLNYMIKTNHISWLAIERSWKMSSGLERIKNVLRECDIFNKISYLPRLNELYLSPKPEQPFKVLFLCRLWEPTKDDYLTLTNEQIEDRIKINQMRVDCIKALKIEFRDEFVGGLSPTKYALEHFPDIVFNNKNITQKRNYIASLKQFSVCIATTGLSNSIGWKFGEYIALSKAVVSEKLMFETSGQLKNGVNYLEFTTAEECVAQVNKLRSDKKTIEKMMQENHNYYLNYLSPQQLILNTLNYVISSQTLEKV
tara:strand:+ start:2391 stop:3491 length:1101 start_codon:yes stop_codon:yes gene_type:complete